MTGLPRSGAGLIAPERRGEFDRLSVEIVQFVRWGCTVQLSDGIRFLNKRQAAAIVGVCPRTFSSAIKEGNGPPVTCVNKREMIRSDVLEQWIEQRTASRSAPSTTGSTLADALKNAGRQQMAA